MQHEADRIATLLKPEDGGGFCRQRLFPATTCLRWVRTGRELTEPFLSLYVLYMNKIIRAMVHAQHANLGKRDALTGLVRDCRTAARGAGLRTAPQMACRWDRSPKPWLQGRGAEHTGATFVFRPRAHRPS